MMNRCKCENCGRSNDTVQIETLSIRGHVADLCTTCAHVLTHNEQNFFSLVRNQPEAQAHGEMKKVHTMLSTLLMVGMLCIVIVAAYGVSQNVGTFPGEPVANDTFQQQTDYVAYYISNVLK